LPDWQEVGAIAWRGAPFAPFEANAMVSPGLTQDVAYARSDDAPGTRVHRRCGADARGGHWREHGDVQRRRPCVGAATSICARGIAVRAVEHVGRDRSSKPVESWVSRFSRTPPQRWRRSLRGWQRESHGARRTAASHLYCGHNELVVAGRRDARTRTAEHWRSPTVPTRAARGRQWDCAYTP